jgi:hypothetical protein
MNARFFVIASALATALLAAACAPAARLSPSHGFAALDGQKEYDYRATTAQGVVVAVRAEPNKLHAPADFWAQAIDARMRRDGYAQEAVKDVQAANGLSGKQLRYVRGDDDRRTYCYWLTVFATDDRVYVVEAGGDKENFDPQRPAVEKAVLALETK